MSKIEFDLVKLKQNGAVNVREAIKLFDSYEEYFIALGKFVKNSKYYLSEYAADMIVGNEDERKNFRADLKKIRVEVTTLGITHLVSTLTELDYEATLGNKETLDKWLNKFRSEVTKLTKNIELAQITSTVIITEKEPLPVTNTNKPIILAVDDKPELLTAVVNMLEDRFRVMAATSAKAALKQIEKHSPELFLLDIEMPQMDGYELAETIRAQSKFKKTPIIFLTSKNTREDVISAISRGGNDYLVKPVNKDLLLSKILQHLGSI